MATVPRIRRYWPVLLAIVPIFGLPVPAGMAEAQPPPRFQLPFGCGEVWQGSTYQDHGPAQAADFNRPDDLGDLVVAAESGTVTRAESDGDTSYGLWVEVDHGNGWTTRYGHLSRYDVAVGAPIRQGDPLGTVGTTGNSSGPHLHFEQRFGDQPVKITFDGTQIHYWGQRDYTSKNSC